MQKRSVHRVAATILTALVLLTVQIGCSSQDDDMPMPASIQRGDTALKEERYEDAVREYTLAIEENDTSVYVLRRRARAHSALGDLDGVIADCTALLALAPSDADGHAERAIAHALKGNRVQARADFAAAIERQPDFYMHHYNLGKTLHEWNEFTGALASYNRAIELEPKCVEAYIGRAAAHLDVGSVDAAIEDCNRALALSPSSALALQNRGNAYIEKGDYDAAKKDLAAAARVAPHCANVHLLLGDVYRFSEEYAAAREAYDTSIRLDGSFAGSHLGRAVLLEREGTFAAALHDAEEAVKLSAQATTCLILAARLRVKTGNTEAALAYLDRAIPNARTISAHMTRAWAKFHRGDMQGAEADAKEAASLCPTSLLPHVVFYRLRVNEGAQDEATQLATGLLERAATTPTDEGAQLSVKFLLGQVPLDRLRRHSRWPYIELATGAWEQRRER